MMSASAFPESSEWAPVSRRKQWPLSEVGSSWDRDEDWGQKQPLDTLLHSSLPSSRWGTIFDPSWQLVVLTPPESARDPPHLVNL